MMYIEVLKDNSDQCYYLDKMVSCCEAFDNACSYRNQKSIVFYDQFNKNYDGKFKIIGISNYFRERKNENDFRFDIIKDITLSVIKCCPFCGRKIEIIYYE